MDPFVPVFDIERRHQALMRDFSEPFPHSRTPWFEPFPQSRIPWFHTPHFFDPFDTVAVSTPWTLLPSRTLRGLREGGDQWQTSLSLPGFEKDNVMVTALDDHSVLVEGKKVNEDEGEYEYKHVCRKLAVPEKVDLKSLMADYKPDGEMILKAGPLALMDTTTAIKTAQEHSHPVANVQPLEDFKTKFNLRGYPPESIKVKVVGNRITVQAKQEKKSGDKHEYRQFHHSVKVPRHIDADQIRSRLAPDGQLTLEARPHREREIEVKMEH